MVEIESSNLEKFGRGALSVNIKILLTY